MFLHRLVLLLVLPAAAAATPAAGIRRCEGPDGVTIYTDRDCASLGAVDRKVDLEPPALALPPGIAPPDTPAPLLRTDCARSTDTLLFDLRRAVEHRNVNRVAGFYHWPGVGSGAARRVMDRLQRIVDRPPAAIEFAYPELTLAAVDPDAYRAAPAPAAPSGVRLLRDELDSAPAQQLRLVRHAGCWWVAF